MLLDCGVGEDLRVPWTAGRSNQSILREISQEYSLKELMLKLQPPDVKATRCEELIPWKRPWCWERLKAGGEGDDRGWDGWIASLTRWIWVSKLWELMIGKPGMLLSMGLQRVRYNWATELGWGGLGLCAQGPQVLNIFLLLERGRFFTSAKQLRKCASDTTI